jgi:hypothetical protein
MHIHILCIYVHNTHILTLFVCEKTGAFCVGESAILSILGWINTMPILVLAARLCPMGMEATMYALIMSISNLGGVIGTQFGAGITMGLGVTEKNLDNFWILVLVCNLSTLLPLLFIGWCVCVCVCVCLCVCVCVCVCVHSQKYLYTVSFIL